MSRLRFNGLLVGACTVLFAGRSLRAENWPSWRGPRNNGVSQEFHLPAEFGPTKNVVWKLRLPGTAGATPVIWGDRIFLTSPDGDDLSLLCVGIDGHERWRHAIGHGNRKIRGDEGNLCSPSPVTDGKHVWSMMGSGDFACYDFNGREVWKCNLQKRYGRFRMNFGMSSTPVLDGDRLFLQLIHGDGDPDTHEAVVIALDKSTGKEIWKQTRISDGRNECESSYASAMLYDDGKLKLLLTHGNDYIIAHRLEDGAEVWRCGGLNPKDNYNETLRFVASPAVSPGLIVVPSAKNGPVLGLRPDGKGNVTDSKEFQLWKRPHNTPDVPSPLIYEGLVYLCRENGGLICLDATDGQEVYHASARRTRHRASPVYADGKIYITSRDGEVTVVKAGRKFQLLASNKLEEQISSSPAVSGGRIYLRTFDNLWCIGFP